MPAISTPQAKDDVYNLSTKFLIVDENTLGFKISQSSLMANDLGGSAKKFTGVGTGTSEKGGTVKVSGTDVIYDPNGRFEYLNVGQTAEDTFTYTIQMGNGITSTATVKVLVQGKNDKPNGNADVFDIEANKTFSDNVLTNDDDVDIGDTLTASLVTGTANGVLELKADGSFTYTPKPNYYGNDTFTYRAYDGKEYSEPVTVTLQGKGEPPKTVFGATKGGIVYERTYAAGDHDYQRVDYNDAMTAYTGWQDFTYNVDFATYAHSAAYETNLFGVYDHYYHQNFVQAPGTYHYGTDPNGNDMTYVSERDFAINHSVEQKGLMEFDVSEAFGLVSGATFKFDSSYNYAHVYDGSSSSIPDPIEFDVYVYAGDNQITATDAETGVLAGKATVKNSYVTNDWSGIQKTAVTLDAAAINAILSSGSDYIGIRLESGMTDAGTYGAVHTQNQAYLNNINVNTASLEFIYA